MAATTTGASISSAFGIGSFQATQLEILQSLVTKHLEDPSLTGFASTDDFSVTSLERGIPRYDHPHLVAALDVLLMYQRNRRSKASMSLLGARAGMRNHFRHDPRTRLIELYKRWLRTHAANASLGEEEVRRMCALCRDVLNHPRLFPSRNKRSFMHTLAEVYEHLKLQLREVLERDRTCAELAGRALCLSRNLISDSVAYLLLAATDLKQTDKLPSLEVVYLWQSLPAETNPLPARADAEMQKVMKSAWLTLCGSLVATILSMRWAFRLFDGTGAEDEAVATLAAVQATAPPEAGTQKPADPAESVPALIVRVGAEFDKGNFKSSGLAGAFREAQQKAGRQSYLAAVEALFDLIYLLGEVLVQFHRISDGLGDYGMIRVAPWLHPFLEALMEKVQRLRGSLEVLNEAVDSELVLAKARGRKVKKPTPTLTMSARAHAAIDRAITGNECHTQMLLHSLDELRARSSPDRLPHVMEGIGDACMQLQNVLFSQQFRARVGDAFPELPQLGAVPSGRGESRQPALTIEELDGEMSEEEDDSVAEATKSRWGGHTRTGLHLRQRAASAAKRLGPRTGDAAESEPIEPLTLLTPMPIDGLPPDGWISREAANGRRFWHHTSLGPPPWDLLPETADQSPEEVNGRNPFGDGSPNGSSDSIRQETAALAVSGATGAFAAPAQPGREPWQNIADVQAGASQPKTLDVSQPAQDLQADVYRLTVAMKGWKQHDRRSLLLSGGRLHIFQKGSTDRVKTVVKVAGDVEVCSLLGNGIMSLQIRRERRRSPFFASNNVQPKEPKVYMFEFCEAELADSFHEEITRLRGRGPLPGLQKQLLDAAARI